MSTFSATFSSRAEHDDLFQNWPFWAILKPTAYDYGAFIGECELVCVECALQALDSGEVESVDVFTIEHPQSSGEYCDRHHDYFIEPYCYECGREDGELTTDATGELAFCEEHAHLAETDSV